MVVKEFPLRAGYACVALDGDREVTRAEFPPEWTEDRRYHRAELARPLAADSLRPPQAGFVAIISDPPGALKLSSIQIEGTVAEAWRAERTRFRTVVGDPPGALHTANPSGKHADLPAPPEPLPRKAALDDPP